jgi:FolB domain-containing protein
MFIIRIKDLPTRTILGVYDREKMAKRRVVLNIELQIEGCRGGSSDAINDAVDYDIIEERVMQRMENASYNLIERLVTDIAEFIFTLDTRIARISIEADKPGALRQAESVSVSLTLDRPSR